MNFAEELMNLDEEEIFGKQKSVDIEESDVMKNLGTLANMINEAVETLKGCDRLLYEDTEAIAKLEIEGINLIGTILEKIEKYA